MGYFDSIFSPFQETIEEKIEKEIDKQVEVRVTKFVEYVSTTYDISLKILLRDLRNIDELDSPKKTTKNGYCLGLTAKGERCKFKAKNKGYCGRHQDQIPKKPKVRKPKKEQEIEMQEVLRHNHNVPPIFDPQCPACNLTKTPENVLIEL